MFARSVVGQFLLLAAVCSACGEVHPNEPTDAALREKFERHRATLEELRRLFEEDIKSRGLNVVTGADVNHSRCGIDASVTLA